jgi:adenosylhomocysteinase
MDKAVSEGDMFICVTGCRDVVRAEHFEKMKDGAVLCNAGHFDLEIDIRALDKMAIERFEARHNIRGYRLEGGKTLYLLAQGRLVNIAGGDGHPAEIMDMSFAIQALSAEYLAKNQGRLPADLIPVPREIDDAVARRKLAAMGVKIDELSQEQRDYLGL